MKRQSACPSAIALLFAIPAPLLAQSHPMPMCGTVLISEDFDGCDAGTWIGACHGWQTWANGSNPSAFFVSEEHHVSGEHALQVAGQGSCWEGSAYKPVSGNHILAKAKMRASGEGPVGCHHYQNGFSIHPVALWSFDMPNGEYRGGLHCSATGGEGHVAIEDFQNAIGQWHSVAIELDYASGTAYFWLDDGLVFSTEFDTSVQVESVWMRSGEGRGWFDDIVVCDVAGEPHPMPTCGTVLVSEDFEVCDAGTWIGACNAWQTWANGSNPSAFFVSEEHHVSGAHALQVAGQGSCWEGSAYKPVTSSHILAKAKMRASGEGPTGCHSYQNGFSIHPVALWSFDMPNGEYQGGLQCSATGGQGHVAVEGFQNVIGQWYSVAIELDYASGTAYFWLDDTLVFSTTFDTGVQVESIWMRSGEGRGWFDDVVVCDVDQRGDLGDAGDAGQADADGANGAPAAEEEAGRTALSPPCALVPAVAMATCSLAFGVLRGTWRHRKA